MSPIRTATLLLGVGICPAALAGHVSTYTADLQTLNADFGSTASGNARVTVDDGTDDGIASLRVQIDAAGLIDGFLHVGHIHGQFAGNAARPLFDQANGPFFNGTAGEPGDQPVDSVLPTVANDDLDGDGFVNFIEGRPAYGPVVLNLSSPQFPSAPAGTPPLAAFLGSGGDPTDFFPTSDEFQLDETYTFDLSDPDAARQFANLSPLELREIVLHGLIVPRSINDPIDALVTSNNAGAPLGIFLNAGEDGIEGNDDDQFYRITAPVAAGELEAVDDPNAIPSPSAAAGGIALLGLLTARRRRKTCK